MRGVVPLMALVRGLLMKVRYAFSLFRGHFLRSPRPHSPSSPRNSRCNRSPLSNRFRVQVSLRRVAVPFSRSHSMTTKKHTQWNKSDIQETLVSLYLRLNGYFVSGFIVHAPHQVGTELDVLAVRFPRYIEPEREVHGCEHLAIPSEKIDFIVGEVKGG